MTHFVQCCYGFFPLCVSGTTGLISTVAKRQQHPAKGRLVLLTLQTYWKSLLFIFSRSNQEGVLRCIQVQSSMLVHSSIWVLFVLFFFTLFVCVYKRACEYRRTTFGSQSSCQQGLNKGLNSGSFTWHQYLYH